MTRRTELNDLELFVAVVRTGSITAGAHETGQSLPAASERIATLERRIGLPLLTRGRRGVVPTDHGASFTEYADRVLEQHRHLQVEMGRRARNLADRVTLAVNSATISHLTEVVAALLSQQPDLTIDLREHKSPEIAELLLGGVVDLGIAASTIPVIGLETTDLWDDSLVVVDGPEGPPTDGTAQGVTLDVALRRPLVGLPLGAPLQDLVDARARELGVEPVYRVRLPTLDAVWDVASTGAAAAIVPRRTASSRGRGRVPAIALDAPWARRRAVLCAVRFDRLGPAAQRVATLIAGTAEGRQR